MKIKFKAKLPISFDEMLVGVYAEKNGSKVYLNSEKLISAKKSVNANEEFEFEVEYKNTVLTDTKDVESFGIELNVKTTDCSNNWFIFEKGDCVQSKDDYLKIENNKAGNGIDIVLKDLSSLGLERADNNAGYISVSGVNDIEVSVENDKKVDSIYTFPFVKAGETVYVKYSGNLKSLKDEKEYWKENFYKIKATSGKNLEDYVIDYDSYKNIKVSVKRDGYKFTTNLDTNGKTLGDYFNFEKVTDVNADHSLLAGKIDWSNTDWISGNSFEYDKYNKALLTMNRNYKYDYDIFTDGIPAVWNNENDIEIKIKKRGYLYGSDFRLKFKIDGVDNWIKLIALQSPEYVDEYKPAEKNIDLEAALTNAISGVESTPNSKEQLIEFIGEIIAEISDNNSSNNSRMVTPSIPAVTDYLTISNKLKEIPSEILTIIKNAAENQKIDYNKAINVGEIPISEWFSLVYELNDEINKVFKDNSWEGRSENVFYQNDPEQKAFVKKYLSLYDKHATIKQFYIDADVDADISRFMAEHVTPSDDVILSAKLKALLSAGVADYNALCKDMVNTTVEFNSPFKAMSITCGIDCDATLTADDYIKIDKFDSNLSDKSNFKFELEVLGKIAIVSSSKKGGIFTINPVITLTVENLMEFVKLTSDKSTTPEAYLPLLDKVLELKVSVDGNAGKVYDDTFNFSDIMEIVNSMTTK